MSRLPLILDTSPLISLCSFSIRGALVINHVLPLTRIYVVDTVAAEATSNPKYQDAVVIANLIASKDISKIPVGGNPNKPIVDSYTRLGQGERNTILFALNRPRTKFVLDDYLAYVVACRFDLKPILLLDLIVYLVSNYNLHGDLALEIVQSISPRYSVPFVQHTEQKLKGIRK